MKKTGNEFYSKASVLKHDSEKLEKGEEIISYQTFETFHQARHFMSVANDEQRELRRLQFFNPPIAVRSRLGQGMHDRAEAIIFANGNLPESDHHGEAIHLPGKLKSVSVLKKHLKENEVWDVSVRGEQWNIDDMEELYVTVNVGELILERGAKIVIRGNVLSLICQRLVCPDDVTPDDYQIGILPTPFSVDVKHGALNGANGADGMHGLNGHAGERAQVYSTILGYILSTETDKTKMSGTCAGNAFHGTNGADGRNGGMCKIAEITIRELQGNCIVFAQGGTGGNGGSGGSGGNGGHGGDGAQGYKLVTKILSPGDGGNGSNGGHAGKGGHGGHGGLASNIFISVPSHHEEQISCKAFSSPGGHGGKCGEPGKMGVAGKGGHGTENEKNGIDGVNGNIAKDGLNGRNRPAPWMFVNEVKRTTESKINEIENQSHRKSSSLEIQLTQH